jgi:Tol biopolymer transport system component
VLHPRPQPRQVLHANLALPEGFELALEDSSLALSPDGRQLALIGARPGERRQLWIRSLERDDLHALPGTNGASYPFWSPDGKWLGFFAELKLQKTPASGGAVQALCSVTEPRGASWSRSGTIVFAPSANAGLSRVPASGGDPVPVTQLGAGEYTHRMPWFLPDGRHLLFAVGGAGGGTEVDGIFALDVDSGKTTKIMAAHSEGRYLAPGYLAFVRDGDLMLRPFDAASQQVSGDAVPIAAGVHFNRYRYTGLYTLADSGILIYDSSAIASPSQMTWFDLEGHELGKLGKPAQFQAVAIAPDGSRAAATVRDQNFEIWLYDLERGLGSKFTFGPAPAAFPVWSPDSHSLAWADGMGTIWSQPIDQSRPVATVLSEVGKIRAPLGWSPDGGTLLLVEQSPRGGDLLTLVLAGKPEPRGLLTTAASETGGRLSPDGRWLLYVSNETGRDELFVTAYPGPGPKWQVSTGGSQSSGWTQASGWWLDGGHRVAYLSQESKLFAVEVAVQGRQLAFGAPEPLFGGRPLLGGLDFTPDGKRLLHLIPLEARTSLTLLSDWRSALVTP